MKQISGSDLGVLAQIAAERDTKLLDQLDGDNFWVGNLILNVDTKLPAQYHNQKGQDLRTLAHSIREMVSRKLTPPNNDKPFAALPGETLRLDAFINLLQQWKDTLRGAGAEDLNPEIRFVVQRGATVTIIRSLVSTGKRNRDSRKMETIDFRLNG